MTNELSKEFMDEGFTFIKICDFLLSIPSCKEFMSDKKLGDTSIYILFIYERLSKKVVAEFNKIWAKCNRDLSKVREFINLSILEDTARKEDELTPQSKKKGIAIKKLREYGLIMFSPSIKCTVEDIELALLGTLRNVLQENPDPELCKKVIINVYSLEENLRYIANNLKEVVSNAEEFIDLLETFKYDITGFMRTLIGVAERLENKQFSLDDEIYVTVLPKSNLTSINVTRH